MKRGDRTDRASNWRASRDSVGIKKLAVVGNGLAFSHQSYIRGSAGIRELRHIHLTGLGFRGEISSAPSRRALPKVDERIAVLVRQRQ